MRSGRRAGGKAFGAGSGRFVSFTEKLARLRRFSTKSPPENVSEMRMGWITKISMYSSLSSSASKDRICEPNRRLPEVQRRSARKTSHAPRANGHPPRAASASAARTVPIRQGLVG